MDFFKIWIMPPLVGGIIGLFTNWLAIKMLFRPLKPIYIGRFKLPFTPGILPREREKLTDSVGDIVSTELLNPQVFKSRINQPVLRGKIEEGLYSIIDKLLSGSVSGLMEQLKPAAPVQAAKVQEAGEIRETGAGAAGAKSFAEQSLGNFLQSDEFRQAGRSALTSAASSLTSMPLGSLVTKEQVGRIAKIVAEKCGTDDARKLSDSLVDSMAASSREEREALLPFSAVSPIITTLVQSLYDSVLPPLESWLEKESTRAKAEELLRGLIRQAIDSLGTVQRLLVSSLNYEKKLQEAMPGLMGSLSEKLMGMLRSPEFREKTTQSIMEYFCRPRQGAPDAGTTGGDAGADLIGGFLPAEDMKAAFREFLDAMNGDASDFAQRAESRYEEIQDKTLGQLLPGFASILSGKGSSVQFVGNSVEREAASPAIQTISGTAPLIPDAITAFWDRYMALVAEKSLGEVLQVQEAQKHVLASRIASAGIDALSDNMGRIIDMLDVKNMVIDKINALDIREAEEVVMRVVKKELNWITALGGILGVLIGIIQSLLSII
ncbi:MAG: DUF445 family protein [Spirochaetaceae bacterium]|nr:DUF445 family protein [Spirochaetaceae bacterium]